ncbi:MAG: hypothetical protein Q4D37_07170 [Oscillospiraceae bacterium]|nr:hypothetical protein [Oscillospiraceae bacterium]
MKAIKWLPALLAIACLTGCGGKTNSNSQTETTTHTESVGDNIVTDISDVVSDVGEAGKDVLTDLGDAAEDIKDDLTGNDDSQTNTDTYQKTETTTK